MAERRRQALDLHPAEFTQAGIAADKENPIERRQHRIRSRPDLVVRFAYQRALTRINAHLCTIVELPSALRKPFCELDLHRRIRSFVLVPREPQPGLDECRQGIDIKRLAHR